MYWMGTVSPSYEQPETSVGLALRESEIQFQGNLSEHTEQRRNGRGKKKKKKKTTQQKTKTFKAAFKNGRKFCF